MIDQTERLFSKYYLDEYLTQRIRQMDAEIDAYNAERLLNTSPESLAAYFIEKYDIAPLHLVGEIAASQQEAQIEIRRRQDRFYGSGDSYFVTGTKITLHIPFEGHAELFYLQPSRSSFSPPRGRAAGSILEIDVTFTQPDQQAVQRAVEDGIKEIRQHVEQIAADLAPFPNRLKQEAESRIAQRREKLLNDRNLVASLGYPLRPRPDAAATYAAPEVQRKAIPAPPASTAPFAPEPALEMAQYEAILQIIQRTATMLERSPARFRQLDEEGLRDQFLVPLNSHFVGQATGETFNAGGKTDILVRSGDKTIFIAECKIWHGAKALSGAVDQLLGYTSWRDTKTAILLFNRGRELSKVLDQIPAVLAAHPQFKRMLPYTSETGFRCVVANRDDPNREITLTVLAFDVPA